MILITILAALLALTLQNKVIEITTTNVQLVLKTVDRLHLLLNNPTCPHSKDYAQKFLEVTTPFNLGIADCQRQSILCNHLNITHYPTLVLLTNSSMTVLDEQQFLEGEGLAHEQDPKVMLNKIVKRLKEGEGFVTVILEEEGLPVLDKDRVQKSSERGVFYINPPSRLYSYLQAMVGNKRGCWIISNKNNHFDKYYCGSGYKNIEVEKYLENFNNQRLVRHVFSRETNSSFMQQAELNQIVKENYSLKKCKVVYFTSKQCQHCTMRDVKKVDSLLDSLKLKSKLTLQIYDLDHEQLPPNFTLRRIPELVQFCNFEMTQYGQIFTVQELTKFLTRQRTISKVNPIPEVVRPQRVVVQEQVGESTVEERLEL